MGFTVQTTIDSYIQVPPDSSGKMTRAISYPSPANPANTVYAEVMHLADPNIPSNVVGVDMSGRVLTVDDEQRRLMERNSLENQALFVNEMLQNDTSRSKRGFMEVR
jgi:hypothetical protein